LIPFYINIPFFAAPLFMASIQFAMQHSLARIAFASGIFKRSAEPLSWQEWLKSGEIRSSRDVI
jgi:hypothetical protein